MKLCMSYNVKKQSSIIFKIDFEKTYDKVRMVILIANA